MVGARLDFGVGQLDRPQELGAYIKRSQEKPGLLSPSQAKVSSV
jgi:hypothetical protein